MELQTYYQAEKIVNQIAELEMKINNLKHYGLQLSMSINSPEIIRVEDNGKYLYKLIFSHLQDTWEKELVELRSKLKDI